MTDKILGALTRGLWRASRASDGDGIDDVRHIEEAIELHKSSKAQVLSDREIDAFKIAIRNLEICGKTYNAQEMVDILEKVTK